jgi:importin-5
MWVFELKDMAKMLRYFDPNHPLLIPVSSVRDSGFNQWGRDDDDEDGKGEDWHEGRRPQRCILEVET